MKVLHIGDVVGAAGGQFLMDHLPAIKREHQIDMTIVNGENSAQGNGITKHSMEQIFTAGADVITTGNHCFKRREALSIYENPTVLRPANYPDGCAGHGVCTVDFGPWQAAVLNLSGTAYLDPLDNPFTIVEQLLEEIFASTGYLAALGVLENGARRREDARRFANFCATSGAGGISALVRAIDAAAQAGSTGQDTVPSGVHPGCVSIMTIHRSKGLQFPVVFVGDTARKFNASDIRQPVLVHRSYGAGLRLRPENGEGAYKTAAYTALAAVHAKELRSEQMRLLYVALTRAQDKLILTVPLSSGKSAKPFAKAAAFLAAGAGATLHQQANSFADWLRAALLVHPDGGALRQLSGNRELLFVQTESVMDIEVCDDAAQLSEEPDAATPDEAPETDPALVEKLRQGFAWQYPAAALAQVPAKVSVTSIVHKAEQTTLERPGFLSKDGLTAAEMGTALHAFLEHADFAALAEAKAAGTLDEAIGAERDRQAAAQLTAPEIAAKLDAVRIRRFVQSEAFAKICAAQQVLRELAFITALPAAEVLAAQGSPAPDTASEAQVLVQGIADLVLVYPDHLELLDYKTDRRKAESDFLRAYRAQLNLYAIAIEKRFAPKKVTYKGIYSFALGKLIKA